MARTRKPTEKAGQPAEPSRGRLYTLDVFLPRRPPVKSFAKKKSGVSRLIQIRGDQTLEALHHAIFGAFDRWDEHLYEFQFGEGPRDYEGPIYGSQDTGVGTRGGLASETTIDSLRLTVGRRFGYLFDFGDDWQHQINVEAIEEAMPEGEYPKVMKRVGKSPPQYADDE